MEQKNDNFNYDEYVKKHEGFFQRIKTWLGKHLKAIFTVGALTLIATIISVYKQCTTSDAGKIIDGIYLEAKNDMVEYRQLMTNIQLPDSIENTQEVQILREYQNKIFTYNLIFSSLMNFPLNTLDITDSKQQKGEYIDHWLNNFVLLNNWGVSINEDSKDLVLYFTATNDSLALKSINILTLTDVGLKQDELNNHINIFVNSYKNTKSISKKYKAFKRFIIDGMIVETYKAHQKSHIMFLNAVNIRLNNIKNQNIYNKYGYFDELKRNGYKTNNRKD